MNTQETREYLAEKIKERRKARQLTQNQLAELLQVSKKGTINRWESGVSRVPARELPRLSAVLNTPVAELLGYED